MPVSPTYPGVYIEEIPSGVRTIVGVATSITAFLGRAPRGPVNDPILIANYGDYERQFGGLHAMYPLSYAVRDFFLSGGSAALIVRLFNADGGDGRARLDVSGLQLVAASPGAWGNNLWARITRPDAAIAQELARRYASVGLKAEQFFNLIIWERPADATEAEDEDEHPPRGAMETFRNLTVVHGPRRVDRVLAEESAFVRVDKAAGLPGDAPTDTDRIGAEGGADGKPLDQQSYQGEQKDKTGLYALDKADLFNLLCIPPDCRFEDEDEAAEATRAFIYKAAMQYCYNRRAMLLVDAPASWNRNPEQAAAAAVQGLDGLGLKGIEARNAALYFPRIVAADPLLEGKEDIFAPSGMIAGLYARTDRERGVWKAPAGIDVALGGAKRLQVMLTNAENGRLNPLGMNCLRTFPVIGSVVWGARTLRGADQLADEHKYVPIRRLTLFIEESLYRGTQWVVFEPNDEPLWAQIRLNIGAFMQTLFRQGAFQGTSPKEAYFVKCDASTTTQNDRNLGIVNIVVGFAPLKPVEFVILKIQQIAGKIEV